MTLLYIIYLGYAEFFETRGSKSLEIINESLFVLIMYNFVLLNGLVDDPIIRDKSGNVIVVLTGIILVINMIVIIYVSVKALMWKCHLRKMKKKAEKEHLERMSKKYIM